MKKKIISAFLSFLPYFSYSQINYEATGGGANIDMGVALCAAYNGGIILGGYIDVAGPNAQNYIARFGSSGNLIWSRAYGGINDEYVLGMCHSADSQYVFCGTTFSYGVGGDIMLSKIDTSGNLLWSHRYGGGSSDYPCDILCTPDNGFLILTQTSSFPMLGNSDVLITKTDANGNEMWRRAYGRSNSDLPRRLIKASDGSYLIVGNTSSFGGAQGNILLFKIGPTGQLLWTNAYGTPSSDTGDALLELSGGNLLIAGSTSGYNGNPAITLIKTSSNGNIIWSYVYYGDSTSTMVPRSMFYSGSDKIVIVGESTIKQQNLEWDGFAIEIDTNGTLIGFRTYGSDNVYQRFWASMALNNHYYFSGNSGPSNSADIFIVSTDATWNSCTDSLFSFYRSPFVFNTTVSFLTDTTGGTNAVVNPSTFIPSYLFSNVCLLTNSEQPTSANAITIFPNPTAGRFTISDGESMIIYDLFGRIVYVNEARHDNTEIDLSHLDPGIYPITIRYKGENIFRKLVISR